MKLLPLLALSVLDIYVSAAPTAEADSASQYVNKTLQSGGYILSNGGKLQVVDETQLLQFLESEGISLETPAIDHEWLNFTFVDNHNSTAHGLPARASCSSTTSLVTDKTETFVDWDVQMSPVVLGAGGGVSVTVASGWSISNAVTVSAGLDIKFIKDRLGGTFGVNYSRTWTSTTSLQYTTSIKDGSAGVWVTRPWTHRRYGRTFSGCPGSLVQTGTWVADSHDDGTYDNAKWVSGFITACVKPAPTQGKLTRCHGAGSFV